MFNNPAKVDLEQYICKEINAFKYLTRYTENVSQRETCIKLRIIAFDKSSNFFFIENIVRNICRQDDIFRKQRKVIGVGLFSFYPDISIVVAKIQRLKISMHKTMH